MLLFRLPEGGALVTGNPLVGTRSASSAPLPTAKDHIYAYHPRPSLCFG